MILVADHGRWGDPFVEMVILVVASVMSLLAFLLDNQKLHHVISMEKHKKP